MRILCAVLLAVVCGTVWPAAAQTTLLTRTYDPKSKTKIELTALLGELPTTGYIPVRATIRNGTKLDRTWTFRFTSTDVGYTSDGNEVRSQFSASCAAGQALSYDFLVPLVTAFQEGYSPTTQLDVSVSAPTLPSVSGSMETIYDPNWPSILLSDTLFKGNASTLDDEVETHLAGSSHGGYSSSAPFGGRFDPRMMSSDWRAYTGYDACLLTEDDWRELTPGARSAMLQWNRMGGSLVIYATNPTVDCQSLGIEGEAPGTRSTIRSWGAVRILTIPSRMALSGPKTIKLVQSDLYAATKRRRLDTLRNNFQPSWPLHGAFGTQDGHIIFFILVLIAFGVLVGPVNLFVFAKAGRRHRLFVTTPIISVGASLLLIVLILFQDGFGGRGHRLLLLEVRPDNAENAAYLSQEQIARTGVLLGTSFTTSEPGYLTPVLVKESRWARVTSTNDGGDGHYTVDVQEEGLKVAGDWFQSRSEHGHLLEGVRPTRGRIELISSQPTPVVTSTFEFPLETLFYLDMNGVSWTATNIQQGRHTKLTPATEADFNTWVHARKKLFTDQNKKRFELTSHRKGHFIAASTEVPAIETLKSISWKKTDAVITGPILDAGASSPTPELETP